MVGACSPESLRDLSQVKPKRHSRYREAILPCSLHPAAPAVWVNCPDVWCRIARYIDQQRSPIWEWLVAKEELPESCLIRTEVELSRMVDRPPPPGAGPPENGSGEVHEPRQLYLPQRP